MNGLLIHFLELMPQGGFFLGDCFQKSELSCHILHTKKGQNPASIVLLRHLLPTIDDERDLEAAQRCGSISMTYLEKAKTMRIKLCKRGGAIFGRSKKERTTQSMRLKN